MFDLVVTDHQMPRLRGVDLAKKTSGFGARDSDTFVNRVYFQIC